MGRECSAYGQAQLYLVFRLLSLRPSDPHDGRLLHVPGGISDIFPVEWHKVGKPPRSLSDLG